MVASFEHYFIDTQDCSYYTLTPYVVALSQVSYEDIGYYLL